MLIKSLLFVCLLLFTGCESLSQRNEIGDGSVATVNQTQDKANGAKVNASAVDEIVTNNTDGIPVYWFIVGALVFGMIIPQPRFVRWLF